jgi:hypothetical protein
MEYLIGIGLALALTIAATAFGLDRERVFYPAMMIAIAGNYILFGAISGSGPVVIAESISAVAFMALAVIGFKTRLWIVVAALAGHGVFDLFHHLMIDDPGVPAWWPEFCLAFDVVAAVYLAVLLLMRPNLARPGGLKYHM